MGCIMVRQCHSNTCPVGVCTQRPDLRERFTGTPEKVINLMSFIAEEVREVLASLGLRTLKEAVGRTDLLRQVSRGDPDLDDLDLNPILAQVDPGPHGRAQLDRLAQPGPGHAGRADGQGRAADARGRREDAARLQCPERPPRRRHPPLGRDHPPLRHGPAGRPATSPSACAARPASRSAPSPSRACKLEVFGDANDYVGKGLSGGTIVVRPLPSSPIVWADNAIIGNTCLYGATAGKLFAAGRAGERFAVRNSGASTVVEGCGDNGCEYMTGGVAVLLGPVGDNFAAGMSGGMAYVWDPQDQLAGRINADMVIWQRLEVPHYIAQLRGLLAEHQAATQSPLAERILREFDRELGHFWQVVPKEMLDRLEVPVRAEAAALRA